MEILSYVPTIPNEVQYRYHIQERILFVHFAPNTWQGQEYDDLSTPLELINPSKADTDQWCQAALAFGAKEVLFVAKHVGGFCWWQTESSEYSIKNTPYKNGKGDLLAELSASCKKYGLNLGVYVYPGDAYYGAILGGGGVTRDPEKQQAYIKAYRTQLTEVLSNYGDMIEIWFDGSNRLPIADIMDKYAKNSVIFQSPKANIRWCGNENGETPYPSYSTLDAASLATGLSTARHSNPQGNVWADIECDVPLYTHKWFWSPSNEELRKSVDELMLCYYRSVGRGAVLLLNSSPNTDGVIPEGDMKRYQEFGAEIERRFGKSLEGEVTITNDGLVCIYSETKKVNHIRIAEDIRFGERIREYKISVLHNGTWTEVCEGSMIGASRIEVFPTVEADAVRLIVTKSAQAPHITYMNTYCVTDVDLDALTLALQTPSYAHDNLWQVCGVYESGRQTIDLTPFIRFPGEYRVEFRSVHGEPVEISDVGGILEEILVPGIVHCETMQNTLDTGCPVGISYEKEKNYIINRTAVVEEGCTTKLTAALSSACEVRIMPMTNCM